MDLRIDPELRDLLPAVYGDDLEKQILAEGKRDPVVVWTDPAEPDEQTICGGHRGYEICKKHNLPFQVVAMDFADRGAVIRWMISDQSARRNWSAYDRAKCIGRGRKLIQHEKEAQGLRGAASKATKEMASMVGISVRQAYRHKALDKVIDAMEREVPDVAERVKRDMNGLSARDLISLGQLEPAQQQDLLAQVDSGAFRTIRDCLRGVKSDELIEQDMIEDGEIADSAKQKPPAGDPASLEKIHNWFLNGTEQLGKLKRLIDRLGDARPGPMYQKVMDNLDKAGIWLQDWRKWHP